MIDNDQGEVKINREEKKDILNQKYGDIKLERIIHDTYFFIKDVLDNAFLDDGNDSYQEPVESVSYISLPLFTPSDTLYIDCKGRIISKYIMKRFFCEGFSLEMKEEKKESIEENGTIRKDSPYSLSMRNFPKNIYPYKREIYFITQKPINVIFLDIDGVLFGMSDSKQNQDLFSLLENRVKILADICQSYCCKVVISSGHKNIMDENERNMDSDSNGLSQLFSLFHKYHIEVIGRTPNVEKKTSEYSSIGQWKEDEIRLYLFRHPEIIHYCVLDDEDTVKLFHWKTSDLEKVRDHLVSPFYYDREHPEKEGLQPYHKEEIGKVLQKENEIRQLILKRNKLN